MKITNALGVLATGVICVIGCTKEDNSTVMPPSPPPPPPGGGTVELAKPADTTPPPGTTPPPVGGAADANMPAAPVEEPKEFKDPDGKTISLMQYMESLAQGYERTRASQAADPNQKQWPPLTDLNQLVSSRMMARLPAAPAGQKFVYDPNTGKVTLAPK